jgi:hypothetical protein
MKRCEQYGVGLEELNVLEKAVVKQIIAQKC